MRLTFGAIRCAAAIVLCAACSVPRTGGGERDSEVVAPGDGGPAGSASLTYEGAIAVVLPGSGGDAPTTIELSAPILPNLWASFSYECANYPTDDPARQLEAALAIAMTFPALLEECAPDYPEITLQPPGGPPLSADQLEANYETVSRCAYLKYHSKPGAWIPQLLDDVDVCGLMLGSGWRLPREADLMRLTDEEYRLFEETAQAGIYGAELFSLHVYVRGADGALHTGTLYPDDSPRLFDLTYDTASGWGPTCHLDGSVNLRCMKGL